MRQSNLYSHLTNYQRTSGPVKAIVLVLSLWDNKTCTVTSLITRGLVVLWKQYCWFCHCETIKLVQSIHRLPEDQWSCKISIAGFVTVRQSNMNCQLFDYQRTDGPVKTALLILSLWDNETCTVTLLITRGPVALLKQHWGFCYCETIKQEQSPHWLPEEQRSCKNKFFGFVTVGQSNMYTHLTDYQRTSCPVKTTLFVLSLWDNQKCTFISLITRGPVVR